MGRWSKGVISETLRSFGGDSIPKGTKVEYKRMKTVPDKDGFHLTEYEWHYRGNGTYIRSYKRIIEGLELIVEPIIRKRNENTDK